MMAHSGAPQVTPFSNPDKKMGVSDSFLMVDRRLFPGFRRSKKEFSSSMSMASPEGSPSIFTPMALP